MRPDSPFESSDSDGKRPPAQMTAVEYGELLEQQRKARGEVKVKPEPKAKVKVKAKRQAA